MRVSTALVTGLNDRQLAKMTKSGYRTAMKFRRIKCIYQTIFIRHVIANDVYNAFNNDLRVFIEAIFGLRTNTTYNIV